MPEVPGGVGVSRATYILEQVLLAEQLARVAEQHLEQVPLGGGQPDVGPGRAVGVAADPLGGEVDDQISQPEPRFVTVAQPAAPDRASGRAVPPSRTAS